ncbi:hypothetical protein SEA_SALLYK_54 [Microbacterium phage SallyK]|nr:hypothetical protein SEA_SALLYK_54 [Microbacterium phage SallyK]
MTSIPIKQIVTKTGANVRLFGGDYWPALRAEHGPGMMLMIDMPYPDGRHAEVYLDEDAMEALEEGLGL